VITVVDNDTAQQNVTRMAEKQGYVVRAEQQGDDISLYITSGAATSIEYQSAQPAPAQSAGPLVLVIPDERMGRGDLELGDILIRGFFHTLGEVDPLPATIIFFNSGVKLVVEGSKVLEDLSNLLEKGIEILACGTCLGHYNLKEKIAVGTVSNMYTIAETLLRAGKVISL
jgi:selenium metabolism protein YedF